MLALGIAALTISVAFSLERVDASIGVAFATIAAVLLAATPLLELTEIY